MDTLDTKLIEQSLEVMSLESRFHNPGWLHFTKTCLRECAPLDFFLQPASRSGQWHQGYELGVGGLIRHTVAAMEVARTLFPLYHFTKKEEDSIISALALHDLAKPSKTHPIEVKALLEPMRDQWYNEVETVVFLIETHHGQWDYFGRMPHPKSTSQQFVHLCDYIASRKNIAVDIHYKEENT